jgi:hypothetical protein
MSARVLGTEQAGSAPEPRMRPQRRLVSRLELAQQLAQAPCMLSCVPSAAHAAFAASTPSDSCQVVGNLFCHEQLLVAVY